MNKSLLIFIILSSLLILSAMAYQKYCASKPNGCKKTTIQSDDDIGGPYKGIDW